MHFDETIAAVGESAVVRGHQESDAFVRGDVEKKLKDGGAGVLVERTGGLVGQQNFRVVHQCAADCGTLSFTAGELLNFLIEAVGEAGSLSQFLKSLVGEGAICSGCHGRYEAVFRKGKVGDEIVELKYEAYFMTEQFEQIAVTINLNTVDGNAATVRSVKPAEEMKECAFAAAGWAAERDGLALTGFKIHTAQNSDGPVVVGLPHVLSAENKLTGTTWTCGDAAHSNRSASTARMRIA
jgi:hypothetical protein